MLAVLLLNLARLGGEVEYGGRTFPHSPLPDTSHLPSVADSNKKKKQYNLEFIPLEKVEAVIERAEKSEVPQIVERASIIKEQLLPKDSPTIEYLFDQIEQGMESPSILQEIDFIEQVEYLDKWLDEEDLLVILIQHDRF